MKATLKYTALLLVFAGFFVSCNEEKDPPPMKPFLIVDETPRTVTAEGETLIIAVSSNGEWTAVVEDAENNTWLSLTKANNSAVTVNIGKNTLHTTRRTTVKITLEDMTKSVKIIQDATKEPCGCIMDTLKGEWSWFMTLRGGFVGGSEGNGFKSIIKILNQNEDGSINYEVFVVDTLFHLGSFIFEPAWSSLPSLGVASIKLPHQNLSFTDYGIVFEIAMDRKKLMFCLPTIAPRCYVYEKIKEE
jgi:hypothetical protein